MREVLEGEGKLIELRPPVITFILFLSSQVKENTKFPVSTTAVSTMAEHVRVTSPTPPATRGPEGTETDKDTQGAETVTHTIL